MQCYVYICRHITRIQNDFLSSVRIKVHLEILTILAFRRHLSIYVYLFIFSFISSFLSLPTVPFSPPPPRLFIRRTSTLLIEPASFWISLLLFLYLTTSHCPAPRAILFLCFPLSLPAFLFLSALFSDPPFPWTLAPLRIPLMYRGVRSQRTMKHSTLASIS